MGIGNRVKEAIEKIVQGDFENALIQISIAIDASGKKKRPKDGVGVRYKSFIRDHESFIVYSLVGIKSTASPVLTFPNPHGDDFDIAHAYYKSVRNGLLHEGEIGDKLEIIEGNQIAYNNGKVSISQNILWSLLLVVICDPVNANESIEGIHNIQVQGKELSLHNMWGKLQELHDAFGYSSL